MARKSIWHSWFEWLKYLPHCFLSFAELSLIKVSIRCQSDWAGSYFNVENKKKKIKKIMGFIILFLDEEENSQIIKLKLL